VSDQALPPEDSDADLPASQGPVREEMLLAYLMNSLPEDEHARVEALVAAHPELKEQLDRIRACLDGASEADSSGDACTPPRLAGKTCRLVGSIRRGLDHMPKLTESSEAIEPEDVIEDIEQCLETGKFISYPGKQTRMGAIMRRLFPNYLWNYAHKAEGF